MLKKIARAYRRSKGHERRDYYDVLKRTLQKEKTKMTQIEKEIEIPEEELCSSCGAETGAVVDPIGERNSLCAQCAIRLASGRLFQDIFGDIAND